MKIFNTLTRSKDELVPITPGEVKIYACGPTVYNYIHIGNARPLCVFDVLRRYLEWRGYKVNFVQNFTDIDDKLIKKANEEGITVPEVAERFIKEFWVDAKGLNVREATTHPRATENIDEIRRIISELVEKGYAYTAGGDVYFRSKKFDEYGKLSHQPLEDLEAGARIATDDIKEDPMDFCLWKGAKPGEPYWESPWGQGRPGWHIECSAMNKTAFGEQIDLHGGGRDLIFPHHENEIAQTEALTGKQFVKYWVHNGLIKVNGQKMSKSLGNSLLMSDLLKKFPNEAIKFALLQTNYRNDINITDDLFPEAEKHLYEFYKVFTLATDKAIKIEGDYPEIDQKFDEALSDDFNTALALSELYAYFKRIKSLIAEGNPEAGQMLSQIKKTYSLLGIFTKNPKEFVTAYEKTHKEDVPEEILALANQMQSARLEKNYALADSLRAQILEKGYAVMISKEGVSVKKA